MPPKSKEYYSYYKGLCLQPKPLSIARYCTLTLGI